MDADLVIPFPDSGTYAALGYSEESRIPFEMGMIRNHYVGRTFISPAQKVRDMSVRIKFNPVAEVLEGKRVVVVDDSIVRGTTMRKLVKLFRQAGAKEVHLRIASPPVTNPCYYGIDTPVRNELIASSHTVDEQMWEGQVPFQHDVSVDATLLLEGTNTVTVSPRLASASAVAAPARPAPCWARGWRWCSPPGSGRVPGW